jgi:uncharacterized protein (TIGR03435 family)
MRLIMKAYGIQSDQVNGPDRLISDKYMVDAIVPSGASMEQFRQMLQNLLVKRFRLAFRWEDRDFKVYHLVVTADGPKLRPSAVVEPGDDENDAASPAARLKQPAQDGRGCPVLPLTRRGAAGGTGACETYVGYSMSEVAANLAAAIGYETMDGNLHVLTPAHVVDDTDLKGRFDFTLYYNRMLWLARVPGIQFGGGSKDSMPPIDSIFKVVQNQLGLKLVQATSKLKVMLIQHVETDPGGN